MTAFVYVCDGCRSVHVFGVGQTPPLHQLGQAGWKLGGWDEDFCPDCVSEDEAEQVGQIENGELTMRDRVVEMTEVGDVECLQETDRAILCRSPLWDRQKVWIPKSVIDEGSEVGSKGDMGLLVLALWFAEEEDLV